MDNLERQQKQKKFDEVKHTLRKFEGLLEIGILTVVYYLFWRNCYDIPDMPTFYYKGIKSLSFIELLSRLRFFQSAKLIYPLSFESGYTILNWLISHLGFSFHGFLVIYAAFCILSISNFIIQNSSDIYLSFSLFVVLGMYTYSFYILRQTLALCILLFAFSALKEEKNKKFWIILLLAFTVHRVSIIYAILFMIRNIKMNRKIFKKFSFVIVCVFIILPLLSSLVLSVLQFFGKTQIEIKQISLNNLFFLMILLIIFIYFFADFSVLFERKENNLLVFGFLFSIVLETFGLYNDVLARSVELLYICIIVLLPNILQELPNKKFKTIIKILIYMSCSVFYIMQLKKSYIVPYESIFS